MSSISANSLFPVTATVINTGSNGLSFAGNFLDDNALIPISTTQSTLQFNTITAVQEFFGANSTEALVATNYFNSFDNSVIKPGYILFTRYIDALSSAYMVGNKVTATIAQFQAITSGSITFQVNGTAYPVTGIDLSSDTSYSAVAATVQAAIRGVALTPLTSATVVYSSSTGAFTFNTGLGTGTDTIDWCSTGTLAGYMGFETTPATNLFMLPGVGYLSQGSGVLTNAQNLARLTLITQNFASFTNVFDTSADNTYAFDLAASTYANASGYAFFAYNNISSAAAIAMTAAITATTDAGVVCHYGTINEVAFAMGIGASINYNKTNGVIAWAFKSQTGLAANVTDDVTASALITDEVNFYGKYSNQSNTYNFYQQGRITGQFVFTQNFYNQMWLANGLQNALLSLFANASIIGYSTQGYTLIQNALDGVMQAALNNGVATKGNTFSPDQVALLIQQAGFDISSFLTNYGYYIQIQPVTGDQRASNVPPPTTVWYTNGGVILTLPVTTTYIV